LLFHEVSADGWVADLIARLEGKAKFAEEAAPAGFQGELCPYQVRGYSWLAFLKQWGLGACLADDMGLGKTNQAARKFPLLAGRYKTNGCSRTHLFIGINKRTASIVADRRS
jgi:SNF2 family DNA or RNA helicase